MSSIIDYLSTHTNTSKAVLFCPVVGAIVPIATGIYLNNLPQNELSNPKKKIKKMIGNLAGVQLLSCGIAGTSAYLLSHYAVFAAVFKISAIFGGIVLGATSFFIAPAVILGLYGLYLLCKKIPHLCPETRQAKTVNSSKSTSTTFFGGPPSTNEEDSSQTEASQYFTEN